MKRQNRAQN